MNHRQAFLDAIAREPKNYSHRYIFADWLDEQGEHEEATRQRKYEESEKWLRQHAIDNSGFMNGFGFSATEEEVKNHPDHYEDYQPVTRSDGEVVYVLRESISYAYEGNPYVQLILMLTRQVEGEYHLPFDTPYDYGDYSDELWEHFEVVTGKKAPPLNDEYRYKLPPFSCAC